MKETRFKQTELGLIPADWALDRVGTVFETLPNNTFSRELLSEDGDVLNIHYGDVLVKYPSIVDVTNSEIPAVADKKYYPKDIAIDGDIIMADTAEDEVVGKVIELQGIGDKKVVSGLHTIWYRTKIQKSFAPGYLGYFLNSELFHSQLLPLMQGIKVLSLSKATLSDAKIVYPSIKEQSRIAEALSDVDTLIQELGELIEKKRLIKQGAMQQLLSGKTRLPGFSKPWTEFKLSDVFEFGNGYTPSKGVREYWENGTLPWFRLEDIRINGRILSDSIQHITPLAVKNSGLFPAGSFILSTTATIGEHALLIADSLANQRFTFLWNVNRSTPYDTMFYYHYLFIIGQWCKENFNDGGLLAVNTEDLKNFICHVPSDIQEQKAIAEVLTDMDNEIAELESKREKYQSIKQGMMQELLTGRIRLVEPSVSNDLITYCHEPSVTRLAAEP